MSYEIYKNIHVFGVVTVFSCLSAMALHSMNGGAKEDNRFRKLVAATHGTGLLIVLIGGMGLLRIANIESDFLIIILRDLLQKRPKDLRIILMSATLNAELFASYYRVDADPQAVAEAKAKAAQSHAAESNHYVDSDEENDNKKKRTDEMEN